MSDEKTEAHSVDSKDVQVIFDDCETLINKLAKSQVPSGESLANTYGAELSGSLRHLVDRHEMWIGEKVKDVCWYGNETVVSGSQNGLVLFWDPKVEFWYHYIKLRVDYVWRLGMSPNRDLISVGDLGGNISVFKLPGASELKTARESIQGLPQLGEDARDEDETKREKARSTAGATSPLKMLQTHEGYVSSLLWSDDQTSMVSTGEDGLLVVWDVKKATPTLKVSAHTSDCTDGDRLSDNVIVTSSCDQTCRLFDLRTDEKSGGVSMFCGHEADVNTVRAMPCNEYSFASAGNDSTVRLWDIRAGKCLFTYQSSRMVSPIECLEFSASGRYIFVGTDFRGDVASFDTATGEPLAVTHAHFFEEEDEEGQSKRAKKRSAAVTQIRRSPDGHALASSSFDGTVKLWA